MTSNALSHQVIRLTAAVGLLALISCATGVIIIGQDQWLDADCSMIAESQGEEQAW